MPASSLPGQLHILSLSSTVTLTAQAIERGIVEVGLSTEDDRGDVDLLLTPQDVREFASLLLAGADESDER